MNKLKPLILALFLAATAFLPTSMAQTVDAKQEQALKAIIADFNKAAEQRDLAMFANNMPQRLVEAMALRMETTPDALRADIAKNLKEQLERNPETKYSMDAARITFAHAKDDSLYALIPTTVETDRIIRHTTTLGLYANDQWYIIYGGTKVLQNRIFLEIYPSVADIQLTPDRVEPKKRKP